MRIARVIERLPPVSGGKEIHGAELSRALRRHAVDDMLFWQEGDIPAQAAGVRRERATRRRRDAQLLSFCAWASKAITAAHRRRPFDLIHAHGDFAEAAAVALLSQRLRIPAVLSVHGSLSERPSHRFARHLSYSQMARIFTASTEIADQIRDSGVDIPITVRPSGVRDPFFRVERRPIQPPTFLTVGRLNAVKGIDVLIAARDKLIDRDVYWIVAAAGEGEYADRIRSELARRPNMSLIDVGTPEALASLHARAHAFVLPSVQLAQQAEGMPTALMEAMASRTPIIATATGGVARALGGGELGVVIPPGDAGALADAVAELLEDPAGADLRAERAASSGLSQRWDAVADQLKAVYSSVLAPGSHAAAVSRTQG